MCFITLILKSLSSTKKNFCIYFNNGVIEQYNKLSEECQKELAIIKEKIKKNEKDNKITNNYEYKTRKAEISHEPIITKNKSRIKR